MRSRSKSRPSDYIQSGNRITRAKNKEIASNIETNSVNEVDICNSLIDKTEPKLNTNIEQDDQNVLLKHYQNEFLNNPVYSFLTYNMSTYPNKNLLIKLYTEVVSQGGFKEVTAWNNWKNIDKKLNLKEYQSFQLYKSHLFHYEKLFNEPTKLRLNPKNDGVWVDDLDPNYLIPAKVFEITSENDINQELIQEALRHDVWVIRNFEKAVKFNKSLFDIKKLSSKHPEATIDIVTQDPDVKTFHRTKHEKQTIKLSHYLKYQQKEGNEKDVDGNIKFGVNLDIGTWEPQIDELVDKIPEEFLFCSEKDILQYVRHHILGMTQPQMYIKVKGSWTGGHEENLRYRAINLNHGPDSSEWNCVGSDSSRQLREAVRDTYKVDIYKNEGLWFADVDFCLANKIPVVCFNQIEGDLVILGPGCEHWVRSFGKAVQTAWNFGYMDKWQLRESIARMDVNSKINFKVILL